MARTVYGVNDAEAVKLWSKKLMREALKQTWVANFMGDGSDSLLQVKDDLSKSKGDRMRCILRMQLAGAGIQGDGTLEGNEEALVTHTDDLFIDQLRHAVRSGGRMTEQRIPFEVREEARMGLQDWFADRFDTWFFNQISGNTAVTDTKFTGNQSTIAPSSTHHIFAGTNKSAESSLSVSDTFSLAMIDQTVLKARTLSPVLRPCNTGTKQANFVMFVTPEMHYDLRRNTATAEWQDIQKAAIQGGEISENPIFTGALGLYNGVILHEAFRLPVAALSNDSNTDSNGRGRAVLCGAQAGILGFGRGYSAERMEWVEELFDYQNQLGVSAGFIGGLKKTVYNSADFATIVVSAAHSQAATDAAGRS